MTKYNKEFWAALALIIFVFPIMIATYDRHFPNFFVGPFRLTHWMSWIGILFIAIFTPMFYVLRRRYRDRNAGLTRIHIFGELVSFILLSIHFSEQLTRSLHPQDETGVTLYIITAILVATGFIQRFQLFGKGKVYPPHRNRFLHVSLTLAFYIVLLVHVLHTLGFI